MRGKRNKYIGGGTGTVLAGVWAAYSKFTTARDLGDDAGWLAKMLADPPAYAPWLLVLACVLFLAWVFWKRDDADDEPSNLSQKTKGHGSPNFGSVNGPVTVNYGAQHEDRHETKPAKNRPNLSTPGVLEGLERALTGTQQSNPPGLDRYIREPRPDFLLNGLLVKVYKALGPVPRGRSERDEFHRRVDLEIADQVSQNDMHVWGRYDDKPLQQIGSYWNDGSFKHLDKSLFVDRSYGPRTRFTDLHFWKHEVDKIWPEPVLVGTHPGRDTALPQALAYIELREWNKSFLDMLAAEAPAVDTFEDFRQRAFDGKVHTWGQASPSGVWKPIKASFWEHAWPKGQSLMRGDAVIESRRAGADTETFWSVMVSRAEIEKEWLNG